jgi:DNA-binding beta-propeller fold protein YncE
VADSGNDRIVQIDNVGGLTTVVATGLSQPVGVAYYNGYLYVMNFASGAIQQRDFSEGSTPIASVNPGGPYGIAIGSTGNIYLTEPDMSIGWWTNLASFVGLQHGVGNGTGGFVDGGGGQLSLPKGIAFDTSEQYAYIADYGNQAVRRITTSSSLLETIAGHTPTQGAQAGYLDGPLGTSMLRQPTGVAVDNAGNIYVTDTGNNAIRKIAPSAPYNMTTLVNTGLNGPTGITIGTDGNLYVSDTGNNRIVVITP